MILMHNATINHTIWQHRTLIYSQRTRIYNNFGADTLVFAGMARNLSANFQEVALTELFIPFHNQKFRINLDKSGISTQQQLIILWERGSGVICSPRYFVVKKRDRTRGNHRGEREEDLDHVTRSCLLWSWKVHYASSPFPWKWFGPFVWTVFCFTPDHLILYPRERK